MKRKNVGHADDYFQKTPLPTVFAGYWDSVHPCDLDEEEPLDKCNCKNVLPDPADFFFGDTWDCPDCGAVYQVFCQDTPEDSLIWVRLGYGWNEEEETNELS